MLTLQTNNSLTINNITECTLTSTWNNQIQQYWNFYRLTHFGMYWRFTRRKPIWSTVYTPKKTCITSVLSNLLVPLSVLKKTQSLAMGQKVTKNDHIIILNLSQGELYSYCIINIKTQKQSLHLFPHTPPSLPYPPPKKDTGKSTWFPMVSLTRSHHAELYFSGSYKTNSCNSCCICQLFFIALLWKWKFF